MGSLIWNQLLYLFLYYFLDSFLSSVSSFVSCTHSCIIICNVPYVFIFYISDPAFFSPLEIPHLDFQPFQLKKKKKKQFYCNCLEFCCLVTSNYFYTILSFPCYNPFNWLWGYIFTVLSFCFLLFLILFLYIVPFSVFVSSNLGDSFADYSLLKSEAGKYWLKTVCGQYCSKGRFHLEKYNYEKCRYSSWITFSPSQRCSLNPCF